jgi:HEAT repeat protein
VLLYGIDSEVLDVVARLRQTADPAFAAELASALAEQRGNELRRAILELFTETKAPEGEPTARALLADWQVTPPDTAAAAVRYLAAIEAQGRTALFSPLLEAPQVSVASAAIQALGKTGDPAAGELLLAKLSSPEVAEAARGDLILALGELKDARAVPALLKIARSRDEDKSRRMYAAGALGQIGDQSALPVLREMFAERDALLKAAAASALARLSPAEAFPLLLAGMKDENWRVRVECAKALARPLQPAEAEQALPLLFYKAQSDPTLQVRIEAVRTLGATGNAKAVQFLAGLYRDSKNPLLLREESLASAARSSLPAVLDAVRAVIAEETKGPDQKVLEMTARVISGYTAPELLGIVSVFLDSANPIVRIYGARAAAGAGMGSLRVRIADMAANDPHLAARREAAKALAKM